MGLRLRSNTEALERLRKVWEVFELPRKATSDTALGRRGG
jgi:hypothetical protein